MSDILYYSNFCDHSKKIIQTLSKTQIQEKIHFVCIDNRVKEDNKTYIKLQNGKKMIMPETVIKVPAMMNLKTYQVIYGEDIYKYLSPQQQTVTQQATLNNMEPSAFSFGGGGAVASDNFSFLDMDADSLSAKGDGGMRQLYNYYSIHTQPSDIQTPSEEFGRNSGMTLEQLQKQRENI